MKDKKIHKKAKQPNTEPYYLYDYWILCQREELSATFHNRSLEENQKFIEILARDSLFTMKLHHLPLFRAQIITELVDNWDNSRNPPGYSEICTKI